MAESRNCPKCDTLMEYRLGEYDCPSCGHNESGAVAPAGTPRQGSGSGLIQKPPPPPQTPVPGMPGSSFGGQHGSPYDSAGSFDSLENEKNLYIYVNAALYGLGGIAICFSAPFSGGEIAIAILFVLIAAAIQVAILWWILKGSPMWARQCCMGCTGLRLVMILIGLFAPQAAMSAANPVGPVEVVTQSLWILLEIWFFTILYRDATSGQY